MTVAMSARLDHVGLDVVDYEASKAFYARALEPLGLRMIMEPVPEVGGFGDDFPLQQRRGRLPHPGLS
jgi:catechol 2,3-dioxygenase-like lactoylglutathione lyase family enzyme